MLFQDRWSNEVKLAQEGYLWPYEVTWRPSQITRVWSKISSAYASRAPKANSPAFASTPLGRRTVYTKRKLYSASQPCRNRLIRAWQGCENGEMGEEKGDEDGEQERYTEAQYNPKYIASVSEKGYIHECASHKQNT